MASITTTCTGAQWIDGVWADAHTYVDRPGTAYTSMMGERRLWQECSTCRNAAVRNRPLTAAEVAAEQEPTTVTVGEGVVARKYEQTASRDHDVTLVPGTYPLTTRRSPEGRVQAYTAAIPAVAHAHWSSTVELGGVALAGEHRGGELETYSFHVYSYQLSDTNERGTFLLA